MRIKVILSVFMVSTFLLFVGCDSENDNPAGGSKSPVVGTWVWAASIFGIEIKITFKFKSDQTFEETTSAMGIVTDITKGTWTATTDSITMDPTSCQETNEDSGVMETVECEESATIKINIEGKVWTMEDEDGAMIEFVKQ